MLRLIRGYAFSAGHRLSRPGWSDEQNEAVYGCCANVDGHGHDYRLQVAVTGEIDPETGMIWPLEALDRLVRERVLEPLDRRFLNDLFPGPAPAAPTAERLCQWIWERLQPELGDRLCRLQLSETDSNRFEIIR